MQKQIENLNSLGIGRNFRIALGPMHNYLWRVEQVTRNELGIRPLQLAARTVLQRPLERYAEHFNPDSYDGVITDQNREAVARLDSLVDGMNELTGRATYAILTNVKSPIIEELRGLYEQAKNLVSGTLPERSLGH